ncbi:protein kinase domain-containing protein [Nocardiopsis ganjiahuensis]|uniref:protein kinase domain-containing protein n=1 Tax=Nocardiopsis ganjiahuensis TaxID=239984 RepID=UPI000348A9DF|nr:tetratricopeptide repeat protein [Nocardiopsis ganjiahuensis]
MTESGQWVGGFRLGEVIGVGGFGTVHLAETREGGRAAVKLLHPHLAADAKVRRYFSLELANARRVQGFCLAEILDADAEADRPWIATEHVEGPTLAEAVRQRGPFSGGDLQRLAVQTITALSAIHAAGVVHRDFKPANIMLGPDGARVIDFGIARAFDVDSVSTSRSGTLSYMAPEQIAGKALGSAVDLFAWGAVMIYAATGAPAFPGPSPDKLVEQILKLSPETGDLADPLLSIVLACTAKDPVQRPTAPQVWDMLLTGRATAPTQGDEEEPRIPNPPGDVNAMLGLADLMVGRGELSEAERWLRRAVEAGDTDAMGHLGALLHSRGELDEGEQWLRRAGEAGHADSMDSLAGILFRRGELGEAERWLRRAAETGRINAMKILAYLLSKRGEETETEYWLRRGAEAEDSDAMSMLGGLLYRKGEVAEAERWLRRAAGSGNAGAIANLGYMFLDQGEVGEGEQWLRRAAEVGNADAMKTLAGLTFRRGEEGNAEQWYRRAAETGDAEAMMHLGAMLFERGETGEGEQWLRRAAEAGDIDAMKGLGALLSERGEVDEAEQWRRRAREAGADSAG